MRKLPDTSVHKFYQCSAAIALSPGEILITGGGSPPKKDSRIYLTTKNELVDTDTYFEKYLLKNFQIKVNEITFN